MLLYLFHMLQLGTEPSVQIRATFKLYRWLFGVSLLRLFLDKQTHTRVLPSQSRPSATHVVRIGRCVPSGLLARDDHRGWRGI
jgi:hypothetical protein